MSEAYINAGYERSIHWPDEVVEDYRQLLKPRFPDIENATPQQVIDTLLSLLERPQEASQ